jgi:hypothetical protein
MLRRIGEHRRDLPGPNILSFPDNTGGGKYLVPIIRGKK